MSQTTSTITIVSLAVLLMVLTVASGQGEAPPPNPGGPGLICGAKLALCAQALSGGKPSDECCSSLDTAVKTELKCLCGFLTSPQALATFNLTVDTALLIPKSCGIDAGSSMCSEEKAPLPHGVPSVPGPPKNAAKQLVGTGLVGFLLTTISMIMY